jgi:hypothetical protein
VEEEEEEEEEKAVVAVRGNMARQLVLKKHNCVFVAAYLPDGSDACAPAVPFD